LPEPDLNSLSHRLIDAAVLEFGPTEILPPVGAIPVSADRAAPAGPTHLREKAGFSPWEGKIPRDVDSLLEQAGLELSVPLESVRSTQNQAEPGRGLLPGQLVLRRMM